MSGKDRRSVCWGTALFITAGSAVYLGIHWGGAVGEPPYGTANVISVALVLLVYGGHQAGVEKPKLVYVREDAKAEAPVKSEADYLADMAESVRIGREMERRRIDPTDLGV